MEDSKITLKRDAGIYKDWKAADVMVALIDSSTFQKIWDKLPEFMFRLQVGEDFFDDVRRRLKSDQISLKEAVYSILQDWKSRKPENSTLEMLVTVLQRCELYDLANNVIKLYQKENLQDFQKQSEENKHIWQVRCMNGSFQPSSLAATSCNCGMKSKGKNLYLSEESSRLVDALTLNSPLNGNKYFRPGHHSPKAAASQSAFSLLSTFNPQTNDTIPNSERDTETCNNADDPELLSNPASCCSCENVIGYLHSLTCRRSKHYAYKGVSTNSQILKNKRHNANRKVLILKKRLIFLFKIAVFVALGALLTIGYIKSWPNYLCNCMPEYENLSISKKVSNVNENSLFNETQTSNSIHPVEKDRFNASQHTKKHKKIASTPKSPPKPRKRLKAPTTIQPTPKFASVNISSEDNDTYPSSTLFLYNRKTYDFQMELSTPKYTVSNKVAQIPPEKPIMFEGKTYEEIENILYTAVNYDSIILHINAENASIWNVLENSLPNTIKVTQLHVQGFISIQVIVKFIAVMPSLVSITFDNIHNRICSTKHEIPDLCNYRLPLLKILKFVSFTSCEIFLEAATQCFRYEELEVLIYDGPLTDQTVPNIHHLLSSTSSTMRQISLSGFYNSSYLLLGTDVNKTFISVETVTLNISATNVNRFEPVKIISDQMCQIMVAIQIVNIVGVYVDENQFEATLKCIELKQLRINLALADSNNSFFTDKKRFPSYLNRLDLSLYINNSDFKSCFIMLNEFKSRHCEEDIDCSNVCILCLFQGQEHHRC